MKFVVENRLVTVVTYTNVRHVFKTSRKMAVDIHKDMYISSSIDLRRLRNMILYIKIDVIHPKHRKYGAVLCVMG